MTRFISGNDKTSSHGQVMMCPNCGTDLSLTELKDGDQAQWCVRCQSGWRSGSLPIVAYVKKEDAAKQATKRMKLFKAGLQAEEEKPKKSKSQKVNHPPAKKMTKKTKKSRAVKNTKFKKTTSKKINSAKINSTKRKPVTTKTRSANRKTVAKKPLQKIKQKTTKQKAKQKPKTQKRKSGALRSKPVGST